jgi:hypothetical protein
MTTKRKDVEEKPAEETLADAPERKSLEEDKDLVAPVAEAEEEGQLRVGVGPADQLTPAQVAQAKYDEQRQREVQENKGSE